MWMRQIKHTIISWDCSFRNFFHLIDAMATQDYDPEQYEIIYIEQRDRATSDDYNHRFGLKSLYDRYKEMNPDIQIRVDYLDMPSNVPYHLGLCVNKGLDRARGEWISVMDGDMLLPPTFLHALDAYHETGAGVVNIFRRMCNQPVGVPLDEWTKGVIDYEQCLSASGGGDIAIPESTDNKGPLISAHRDAWAAVNGYDTHPIWSTGLSRLGQDVTARLEMFCNVTSTTLPGNIAVHPYHPMGFSRLTLDSVRILAIQADLIEWAKKYRKISWRDRSAVTDTVFRRKQAFIKRLHEGDKTNTIRNRVGQSVKLGLIYGFTRRILKRLKGRLT